MIELVAPPHVRTLDAAPFWDACDEGRLILPRCASASCEEDFFFPPRSFCPRCGGSELGWVQSGGRGTVYAATQVHFAPFARDLPVPFTVCLVDLDERVRMLSRYAGEGTPPIGEPVAVRFAAIAGTEERLPVFASRGEA